MKNFDYSTALNQLKVGRATKINNLKFAGNLQVPYFARTVDFIENFLPYITIVGDSREQDRWIEAKCHQYGISFLNAVKDKSTGTENLKEGDYTFKITFENATYDFTGTVAYERKGSVSEFYSNCIKGRKRVKREFERFGKKAYDKVVLMLQFGETLTDLIDMSFSFRVAGGKLITKNTGRTMFATCLSWKQPNNNAFDIIQSNSKDRLFWLMLLDMFYFFRNEIRTQAENAGLLPNF